MCDICVIESVKEKMLSRRSFFQKSATAAVGAGVGLAVLPQALAKTKKKHFKDIRDLTHTTHEKFPSYFGTQQFWKKQIYSYAKHKWNLFELRMSEHIGTHLDAPLHFSADGASIAEIALQDLVAPLCIIDIKAKAAANADAQVVPEDIKKWISKYGDIPKGACVAMNSGWDKNVGNDKFRNADANKKMHFPGFHVEAAALLLETKAVGIAVDTLSLDRGQSADFAVHYAWLPKNRWGLECVANLDNLPAKGATIIVGASKFQGATGGPSRVFALV